MNNLYRAFAVLGGMKSVNEFLIAKWCDLFKRQEGSKEETEDEVKSQILYMVWKNEKFSGKVDELQSEKDDLLEKHEEEIIEFQNAIKNKDSAIKICYRKAALEINQLRAGMEISISQLAENAAAVG